MADIIQVRRDTSANWTSVNPVLAGGEMGFETNTRKFKFGDGATAWTGLDYALDTANQETFSGVATINFGATPTVEGSVVITGLGNMTTTANILVYVQADESTADNDAAAHDALSFYAICGATARVAATGFTAAIRLLSGYANGTFKIHYTYTL
jgi:hypothetical protein